MDLFKKKELLKLNKEVKSYKGTVIEMRRQITTLQSANNKLEEENSDLKFTLKHQRSY